MNKESDFFTSRESSAHSELEKRVYEKLVNFTSEEAFEYTKKDEFISFSLLPYAILEGNIKKYNKKADLNDIPEEVFSQAIRLITIRLRDTFNTLVDLILKMDSTEPKAQKLKDKLKRLEEARERQWVAQEQVGDASQSADQIYPPQRWAFPKGPGPFLDPFMLTGKTKNIGAYNKQEDQGQKDKNTNKSKD